MINHTNILISGKWYGCTNDEGNSSGVDGARRQVVDNFEPCDDIWISTYRNGKPHLGAGSNSGFLCSSGFYSNSDKGKEQK